jgi:hypothetical protein
MGWSSQDEEGKNNRFSLLLLFVALFVEDIFHFLFVVQVVLLLSLGIFMRNYWNFLNL